MSRELILLILLFALVPSALQFNLEVVDRLPCSQQKYKEIPIVNPTYVPSVALYSQRQSDKRLTVGHFIPVTKLTNSQSSIIIVPDNVSDGVLVFLRFFNSRCQCSVGNKYWRPFQRFILAVDKLYRQHCWRLPVRRWGRR